jgi:AcrR family transcriptional regulator
MDEMPKIVTDETIYNAAMQTVFERGYAGATTKQIAEAADISEVTLFRKYDNKAKLIKQAITAVSNQIDFESATQYSGNVVHEPPPGDMG